MDRVASGSLVASFGEDAKLDVQHGPSPAQLLVQVSLPTDGGQPLGENFGNVDAPPPSGQIGQRDQEIVGMVRREAFHLPQGRHPMGVVAPGDDRIAHAEARHLDQGVIAVGLFGRTAGDEAGLLVVIHLGGLDVSNLGIFEVAEDAVQEVRLGNVSPDRMS